jgi:hypothetical protein
MALRVITLRQYTGHIDEPSSLLAIARTAELGYPRFPSGVLYLQGAVFSFLAAPLAWFFSNSSLLDAARVLQVLLASLAIPLAMALVSELGAGRAAALLAGFLIACDPSLIIWGVAIRPYGLLAVEVLALMLVFTRLVRDGPEARIAGTRATWWIPMLALLGTFTHIGFWVTIAPLAVAALLIWRRQLVTTHRNLLVSGAVSLLPLLLFLILGRFVGPGSGTRQDDIGGSFMGSHIFDLPDPLKMSEYEWPLWTGNFLEGGFYQFMPYLLVLVAGVLLSFLLLPNVEPAPVTAPAIAAVLLVHWGSIGLVILLSAPSAGTRYLLHVLPLGYVLLGCAAWTIWWLTRERDTTIRWLIRVGMLLVLVAPAMIYGITGARWRIDFPGGNPAYWDATAWVSTEMEPGDVLITAMPPPAYFWFEPDQRGRLYFLAGPAGSERAEQYTKPASDGAPVDYWLGIPSITSEAALCDVLAGHAGSAWIVVDFARLDSPDMLGPTMKPIILGASEERHRAANGVLILHVEAQSAWSPEASAACEQESSEASR